MLSKLSRGLMILLPERNILSPALKASLEVLVLLVSILANRLGLNSKNSSKPPSADPNRRKESRKPATRRPGGQHGQRRQYSWLSVLLHTTSISRPFWRDPSRLPAFSLSAPFFPQNPALWKHPLPLPLPYQSGLSAHEDLEGLISDSIQNPRL